MMKGIVSFSYFIIHKKGEADTLHKHGTFFNVEYIHQIPIMIISFHRQWLYYNLLRHSGNRHDMLGWYYRVLEFNFLAFVIYSFICFYYYCFKIISIIRTVLWFDSIFYISAFWHKLTKSWISHYKILHILDGFFNFFVCCVTVFKSTSLCLYVWVVSLYFSGSLPEAKGKIYAMVMACVCVWERLVLLTQ